MKFYKIFKILNSAQSSWQLSLAITFGMISGFLPQFTLFNLLIIFLVLSINIPIVIFLLSSVLFNTLALMLDSTFASLGYDILNYESLRSLFTILYNYAPTLWSSFNHTIVMGSFIISLIAFIPVFVLSNILINKYRLSFENMFKNSKYFSFLNPFNEQNLNKKPKIFRLFGLIFALIIVSLIVLFTIFLLDPILKYVLQFTFSKATNKEIYIKNLKSSFDTNTLNLNNIIIKSKSKNQDISIKDINIKINFKELLHKNVDIQKFIIKDIVLKTNLNINNTKHEIKTQKTNSNFKDTIKNKISLPSVNEILEKENLQSLKKAKEIKKDINNIYSKYKNFNSSFIKKEEIDELKHRLSILKNNIKNLNNASQIPKILEESKSIKKEISNINNKLKTLQDDYNKDKTLLQKHIQTIKTLPKEEFNHIVSKYSLNQDGALNFIGTYISNDAKKYIKMALKYYKLIEPYINSDDKTTIEEKRLKGRYIHFRALNAKPSFVLEYLSANININTLHYSMQIKNISNNQKALNKNITGYVKGDDTNYKLVKLVFIHNGLENISKTKFNLDIHKYKIKEYKAHSKLILNNINLDTKANILITGFSSIKSKTHTNIINTDMNYISNHSKRDKIIKSIITKIHKFDINSNIVGDLKNPSISINSDIDKKIAQGVKNFVSQKAIKFRNELKIKIQNKFDSELGSNLSNEDFKIVQEYITEYQNSNLSISDYISKNISKDILTNKLKDKAKSKVKNKLQDSLQNKLKSLF